MSAPISNLNQLIASMEPAANARHAAFMSFPSGQNPFAASDTICTFHEAEGLTVVADLEAAEQSGHKILFKAGWITLTVHSDLEAVGLTAAFATALGRAGISANVIAGAYHDHIFVPLDKVEAAMQALITLQREASGI